MTNTTRTARELVQHGYAEVSAGRVDALRDLLREDFVEHRPGNPSGRDAWVEFMARSPFATAVFEIKRVIADGDQVAVHYWVAPEGGPELAVVDLWRIEDGLIVEHWDVVQPVPDPEKIPNGMF
jgi:predicted SnoaL-like aldol condensation-catalyzing enzyme